MRTRTSLQIAACCLASFAFFGLGGANASKARSSKPTLSYSKISPLLTQACVKCHNATRHAEGVDLSSYKAIMKGGEHGAIVVAKHPEKSPLILYVDGTKQPRMPMGAKPLSAPQIALLKKWVASGASG